ncbi:hypothetical protein EW145_g926 [Phellinidium pouzarii]|uniref:MARVEL domain-containing protein n=1 Tax=Phellinidium pouzarii TaxID=167371 RepID=A0A4S4LI75_9AGAM|nr:hypothetical protein EW145_g926 [Phellinidium pouzarii]
MLLSLFMMLVPVIDVKYGKLTRLARALSEVRVGFILSGVGTGFSLLIAFISTISAWTEPGCKDPNNDPHSSLGAAFRSGLGGWCTTKKAGSIFFWLTFAFWMATFILNIIDWRGGKRPRDPPFQAPMGAGDEGEYDELEEDEESTYGRVPPLRDNSNNPDSPFSDNAVSNRQSQASYVLPPVSGVGGFGAPGAGSGTGAIPASRPSMDAYGAFSDPTPSGFGDAPPTVPSTFGAASGLSGSSGGNVSRTMQYADPYAAVRASIAGTTTAPPASSWAAGSPVRSPPSYTEYTGYR